MLVQVEKDLPDMKHTTAVAGYILTLSLCLVWCALPCPCGDASRRADTFLRAGLSACCTRLWNCCKKSSAVSAMECDVREYYLDCDRYMEQSENRRMSAFVDDLSVWGAELVAVLDDQATYALMACGHPVGTRRYP